MNLNPPLGEVLCFVTSSGLQGKLTFLMNFVILMPNVTVLFKDIVVLYKLKKYNHNLRKKVDTFSLIVSSKPVMF